MHLTYSELYIHLTQSVNSLPTLEKYFRAIGSKSFRSMYLRMSSVICRPFCSGLDRLKRLSSLAPCVWPSVNTVETLSNTKAWSCNIGICLSRILMYKELPEPVFPCYDLVILKKNRYIDCLWRCHDDWHRTLSTLLALCEGFHWSLYSHNK